MTRSFYTSDHAPYYICALDYIQQSAGIRALHYLCHALNESGLEAYVTCEGTSPQLRTPELSENALHHHHISCRKPIVVYPEIISGDPLAAGGVVARWLLNRPGHIAGDTSFPPQEMIFAYDPSYLPSGMTGDILHIPTCDLSIFNNDDNHHDDSREFVCFYAHKYLSKGGVVDEHLADAVSLCKDQQLTHHEIAALLRCAKVLYVYEPTALVTEALLCGCPVSIIVTDYWKENTSNYSYPPDWGVTMDGTPKSLAMAKSNVGKFRSIYEETVLKDAWIHLDRFIEATQAAAKKQSTRK
ncbi:MAG: hypothetical protein KKG03_04295 [Gammaproteobacteria bacterium]|nr:hypothetical protein [Sideroxydans sp.]MBU3904443.1 hypothetical protein [Gammaproteobacteria bacterium]MBU4046426.1 hypothetical protein [Gammaproteobacteria bacterium]MBU4150853.1 hypothetical protein [Gammaproteobacteria bacterium]